MTKERYSIMLSSTYVELVQHRHAVSRAALGQGMFPLDMANDAAMPDVNLIEASLAKVDEADAYIGLISYRYGQTPKCPQRNPRQLSLTELEFNRALDRGLPICMFIMADDHPVPRRAVQAESSKAVRKLAAFTKKAKKDRIYAEFHSVEDLAAKAAQSLARLGEVLYRKAPSPSSAASENAAPDPDVPVPPALCSRPPYVPGYAFQGRTTELLAIKSWATSTDSVMLFEAIGGMGKSMVTWEWVNNHASRDRADWAGMLWYSFYERGADMRDFCITALSYMGRQSLATLARRPTRDLVDQLLPMLRSRPWLVVLDGLERVLVEYHRSDAAQIPDAEIGHRADASQRDLNACIRPEDDDLLRQLCWIGPSKVLVSSRLMPSAWLNPTGLALPGVRWFSLRGLDPADAELMLRAVGIRGDSSRIQPYLEKRFGCHPLVVGVVGGLVLKYWNAPGDFDRWVHDADGGAAVSLADPDIRQRQNHILKLAFDGLSAGSRDLMARIAVVSSAVDWEMLQALNPLRPHPPARVTRPRGPNVHGDFELTQLRMQLAQSKAARQRKNLCKEINGRKQRIDELFQERSQAFQQYERDFRTWQRSDGVRAATSQLNEMLEDLESRGLLQCDRQTGKFDLHPVVRGYAVESLSAEGRAQTGQHVADYFATRPRPPFETAKVISDLFDAIQVVQALCLAGNLPAAQIAFFRSKLVETLARLEHFYEFLKLLQPFFPHGWTEPPADTVDAAFLSAEAAVALSEVGLLHEAEVQREYSINGSISEGLTSGLAVNLLNHAVEAIWNLELATAERIIVLGREVATAIRDDSLVLWFDVRHVDGLTQRGALDEARALWPDIAKRIIDSSQSQSRLVATALLVEVALLFREGSLTQEWFDAALATSTSYGEKSRTRGLLLLAGEWHQSNSRHQEAEGAFSQAIEMAHGIGRRDARAETLRNLSIARLGHRSDVEKMEVSGERNLAHDALASLYLELGRPEQARQYALEGYREYWADGPPYSKYWQLQICSAVLDSLEEPIPQLPAFDPARVRRPGYEEAVRRLLDEQASCHD